MHLCIKLKLNIQYLKVKPHAKNIANTSIYHSFWKIYTDIYSTWENNHSYIVGNPK